MENENEVSSKIGCKSDNGIPMTLEIPSFVYSA